MDSFYYSDYVENSVNFGTFGSHNNVSYTDNFLYTGKQDAIISDRDEVITEVLLPFLSKNIFDYPEYDIKVDETPWDEYENKEGELYIKLCSSKNNKP
jgi:hypothetical protein